MLCATTIRHLDGFLGLRETALLGGCSRLLWKELRPALCRPLCLLRSKGDSCSALGRQIRQSKDYVMEQDQSLCSSVDSAREAFAFVTRFGWSVFEQGWFWLVVKPWAFREALQADLTYDAAHLRLLQLKLLLEEEPGERVVECHKIRRLVSGKLTEPDMAKFLAFEAELAPLYRVRIGKEMSPLYA